MNKKAANLTARQAAFARAYAETGNGMQSAITAGYKEHSAGQQAAYLLKNPKVAAEIERMLRKAVEATELSIEKVLKEISLLAFADMAEYVEWSGGTVKLKDSSELDPVKRRAIIEIAETANGVKIKLGSKNQALEQLGRYLKMFTDKIDHSGSVENPVRVYLPENNR